jgi:Holliday junction DNA helicase RuvB
MDVKPFTFIGATTRAGLLSAPLRSRFGLLLRLEFYTNEDLQVIVERPLKFWASKSTKKCAGNREPFARHPRIANRLPRRVRDRAGPQRGEIDLPTAKAALQMLEVTNMDSTRSIESCYSPLSRNIRVPVGVSTLAASLAEEADAIEEIYEPFLIQIGFLNRTPRGRVATQLAYDHFGITPTRRQSSLF